jgi:hypothetical protein
MMERTDAQELTTADLVGRPRTEEEAQPTAVQPLEATDMAGQPQDTATSESQDQVVETQPQAGASRAVGSEQTPLFTPEDTEDFRRRWSEIQAGFVDEPRRAVEQGDSLVAEVIQRLATVFADERGNLERQWGQGSDVSTEDLRVALQRYRSFFDRLLTV